MLMNVIHIIIYFPQLIAQASEMGNLTCKKGQIKLFKSGAALKIYLKCFFCINLLHCLTSQKNVVALPWPARRVCKKGLGNSRKKGGKKKTRPVC